MRLDDTGGALRGSRFVSTKSWLAVLVVALLLAGGVSLAGGGSPATAVSLGAVAQPRPPIVNALMRNATSAKYRQDMQAYSRRHYWLNTSVLKPRAIILHYTVSDAGSWRGLINWWDQPEATGSNTGGENPQPAAHFIVEQDGTIYQAMPTNLMVRNAYGMNHVAIGIEFVERSSATNVLNRSVQAEAGLALVRWLMYEHGIPVADVYGHGTVGSSPLFLDMTGAVNDHTDWGAAEVDAFRARLGAVPAKPRVIGGDIGLRYRQPGVPWMLGAPTTDEMDGWVAGVRVQSFVRGDIFWSATTGAAEVYGAIGQTYRSMLGELSPLGLPTSGEVPGPFAGSRMNTFQRGAIFWSPATGARDVYGMIYLRYALMPAADRARLGMPVTGEYSVPGGRANRFERGTITWNAATGATTVTYA